MAEWDRIQNPATLWGSGWPNTMVGGHGPPSPHPTHLLLNQILSVPGIAWSALASVPSRLCLSECHALFAGKGTHPRLGPQERGRRASTGGRQVHGVRLAADGSGGTMHFIWKENG